MLAVAAPELGEPEQVDVYSKEERQALRRSIAKNSSTLSK